MFSMMRKSVFLTILVTTIALSSPFAVSAQTGFQLIVHEDNPYESITQQQASDFFLKKDSSWDDGTPVQPIDLSQPASVREAFSSAVLQRSPNEIKKYWQRQIFTGRNSSPPEKDSESEIIAFVRANRGAIGYVSSGAKLSSGVRTLRIR